MNSYKYTTLTIAHNLKKARLLLLLQFVAITIFVGIVPVFVNANADSWQRVLFVVVLFFIVGAIVIRNLLKKEAKRLKSFELIVDADNFICKQHGQHEIRMPFSGVRRIRRKTDVLIISGDTGSRIFVQGNVNDHDSLESLLESVKPITVSTPGPPGMFLIPLLLCSVVLVFVLTGSSLVMKKVFVPVTLFLLLAGFAFSQFNRKIDRTTRILSWAILLPLAAFICYLILG